MLPSDREKGEFYDIVLGVSTRSLDMDAIESILIRFEQEKANNEGFECEVSLDTLIDHFIAQRRQVHVAVSDSNQISFVADFFFRFSNVASWSECL